MNRVVIIGCGNVGMAYAYALVNQNIRVDELVLIDINREKVLGEVMDLNHASIFSSHKINVRAGEYSDCKNANIVVITAGANQEKNETRMDLINKNDKVIKNITLNVVDSGFKGIFLVATNPVDVMAYLVRKYSNFTSNKIIGSGTIIDTTRLKYILSNKLQINPSNIHASVIGEHGDSEFVLWSKAEVGNLKVDNFISKNDMDIIEDEVKNLAYKIINYKGETSYAIGMCLTKITNSILNNEELILTVSSPVEEIYIGYPSVINSDGIKGVMKMTLSNEENIKFENSKAVIRNAIRNLEG